MNIRPTNRLEHLLTKHGQPAAADDPIGNRPDTHPDAIRDAIDHDRINADAVGIAIAADECDIACDGAHAVAALCASEVKRLDALIENLHHPHAYITPDACDHPNKQFAAHLAYMRDTYEQTRQSLLDTCDEVYKLARVVAPLHEEEYVTNDTGTGVLPNDWRVANHPDHGHVIVTTDPDHNGYVYFVTPSVEDCTGFDCFYCHNNHLTYIDMTTLSDNWLPNDWQLADHPVHGRVIVTMSLLRNIYFMFPTTEDNTGFDWDFCTPDELTHVNAHITKDASTPVLPEGWRIASHPRHGRVIVTTEPDADGHVYALIPATNNGARFDWFSCHHNELTYLDTTTLPSDWRLADHSKHGRVIVTTTTHPFGYISLGSICYVAPSSETGVGFIWFYCNHDALTYIDY